MLHLEEMPGENKNKNESIPNLKLVEPRLQKKEKENYKYLKYQKRKQAKVIEEQNYKIFRYTFYTTYCIFIGVSIITSLWR